MVVVGSRGAMFFIVAAAALLLDGVTITVSAVDAGMQILVMKAVMEVGLIDLILVGAGAS